MRGGLTSGPRGTEPVGRCLAILRTRWPSARRRAQRSPRREQSHSDTAGGCLMSRRSATTRPQPGLRHHDRPRAGPGCPMTPCHGAGCRRAAAVGAGRGDGLVHLGHHQRHAYRLTVYCTDDEPPRKEFRRFVVCAKACNVSAIASLGGTPIRPIPRRGGDDDPRRWLAVQCRRHPTHCDSGPHAWPAAREGTRGTHAPLDDASLTSMEVHACSTIAGRGCSAAFGGSFRDTGGRCAVVQARQIKSAVASARSGRWS